MSSSATASIRPPPSPPCFSADTGGTAETQQYISSNNTPTSNDKAQPISPPALPQPSPQPYTPTTASPPIRCSVPNGTDPQHQQHHPTNNNRGNASSRLLQTMIGFFHQWGGGGGQHGGRHGEDRRATARQVAATGVSGGRRETNKEARVRSLSFDRSSARKPLASSPPPPPPPPPPPAPKLASVCGVSEGSPPLPPIVTLSIPQPEEEGNRPVTPHSQSDERKPLLDWDGDGEMAVSDPKRARSHPDRRLVSFSSLDISTKLPLPPSLTEDGPSAPPIHAHPHPHPHMHPDKDKAETTVERGRTHTNAVSTRSTSIGNEAGTLESRVTDEGWEGDSGGRVVACRNPFHTPEQQQEDTGEEKNKEGEGEEGDGVSQPSVVDE